MPREGCTNERIVAVLQDVEDCPKMTQCPRSTQIEPDLNRTYRSVLKKKAIQPVPARRCAVSYMVNHLCGYNFRPLDFTAGVRYLT
jgi:hypothetical protein